MRKMDKFLKNRLGIVFAFFVLMTPGVVSAQQTGVQDTPPMTAVGQATFQNLSPGQQSAVMQELKKTGGQLTPGAVEALKSRPEFQNLSPAEVARGKELLQKQEAAKRGAVKPRGPAAREAEAAFKAPESTTPAIGDASKGETLFERAKTTGQYQDISLQIKPFGYDFFRDASVKVITDSRDIPVPMKYVVGPGDEVRITLWGRVNASYNLTIDRDGKIAVPNLGPLVVAGMTFEQMSSFLIKQAEQITGTSVDISLGALRTMPIFVLGDVRRPGAYTIGSSATITDALLLSGGPTEIGSMRNIQLRRKDKVIQTFDLYDLLLKGDKSKDVILSAGDIVFVPVIGPYVGVAGNVRRPAIYELRNDFSLESLFALAGGIIPSAYTQQIQVERTVKNEKRIVIDIDDKNFARAKSTLIQDADIVKVFSIVDKDVNVVHLSGNVKKGGKYALTPGMRIKDVLKGEQDLLPETYFDYALIKRPQAEGKDMALVPFSLGDLLLRNDPAANLELQPQDNIYIFSKWFFRVKPVFSISGEVRSSVLYDLVTDSLRDKDAMLMVGEGRRVWQDDPAGNLMERDRDAMLTAGELRRSRQVDPVDKLKEKDAILTAGELRKSRQDDPADNYKVKEAMLTIGEVRKSVEYDLADNYKVKDAILTAGGLTRDASLKKGEIIRLDKDNQYHTIYFDVGRAMADDPASNLLLQDQDRIIIHSVWEDIYKKMVAVEGEVGKPGEYQLTERMTVKDLVFKAGNILESAYIDDAEISSLATGDGQEAKLLQLNINLRKALAGDPDHNVLLKPHDRLFVRRIPDWRPDKYVTVAGEFRFPGRYMIKKGERLSAIIERAGGFKENAYLRGAFFTRERVRVMQQKGLLEMADRLERELLAGASGQISTALSVEEVTGKKAEMEQKQKFIETLRRLKATGRMTIYLGHLRLLKGSPYDIELEEGDSISIPQLNSVVGVVGAVMTQASLIHSDKMSYQDYISESGGYASFADPDNVFVMKVDGSARKLSRGFLSWSAPRERWEMAGFGERIAPIEPGDTIVVPEKTERIAWLREIRDITQILMNVAVSAAVVIKLW
jgi:polysaccharide biosynthesis/export protein